MNQATSSERYEIRVRGLLGETVLAAFPGLHSEAQGGETVLAGVLRDQSALHGVLAQIEALGLELLEVRRNGALNDDNAVVTKGRDTQTARPQHLSLLTDERGEHHA